MSDSYFPSDADAQLHIVGSETADHTISVDVLARTLTGLQQTALLLATLLEGTPVQERLKKTFRQRYGLRCGALRPGTVNVPLIVGEHPPGHGVAGKPAQVLNQIYQLLDALGNQSEHVVNSILPDPIYRGRVLDSVYEFLPKSDDRWSLGFAMPGRREVQLGRASAVFTHKLRQLSREKVTIVPGRVVAIDDTKRRITIDVTGIRQELRGLYPIELEDILLRNFKKPVRIVGLFGLDIDGDLVTLKRLYAVYGEQNQNLEEIALQVTGLSEEDADESDEVPPTPYAIMTTLRILGQTYATALSSLPMPTSVTTDGEGGVYVYWMQDGRNIRLLIPSDARDSDRQYIYHQEGEGHEAKYEVERQVTSETLTKWVGWLAHV